MASITFKNVNKSYDKKKYVIENFNLEIEDKEFVVFVGPSGCGKSTTIRMIAGLEDISDGEIYKDEREISYVSPGKRGVAMVFQNYALYPHMSVKRNISFGLKLKKKFSNDEIERKVAEVAETLGLTPYLNRKPAALSGGQRQRVALARAMVSNADVYLLDEPLSNLDAKLRNQMRSEISRLHEKLHKTFIYVTHDQTEAMTMGDRIVVMKNGKIMQVDAPQKLYDKPNSVFVASFIGTPQMNFLDGVVLKHNDNFAVKIGDLTMILPPKHSEVNLENYVNRDVIVGIRPENIHMENLFLKMSEDSSFEALTDFVEMTGAEQYLHFDFAGHRVIARVPIMKNAISKGDTVELSIDVRRIHIFDKDTEMAVCH